VSALRVLFIGGSGIISSACCRLAVQRGLGLYTLNRGTTRLRPLPLEVTILHGDIRDQASVREALGDHEFDVVVNGSRSHPNTSRLILNCSAGESASTSSSVLLRRIRRRRPACR
jgi:nucleoside-diphosphate-sugar epimerase